MKLSKAIIETVKEWASLLKSGICYVTRKENLTFTAKILWLLLPVPSFFCILYVFIPSYWILLWVLGTVTLFFWMLFWLGVYTNMDVLYSSHYDEATGKWVIDYKEEMKEELPKP